VRRAITLAGTLAIVVLLALPVLAGTLSETYTDMFSAQTFSGNDGTLDYSGPWIEIGESNGPKSGYVWVWNHSYCEGEFCLKMGGTDADAQGRGAYRAVDLTDATQAKLIFDYGRELLGETSTGTAVVQISPDGGNTWNSLKTISLDSDDSGLKFRTTVVITQWATTDTLIRFKITEAEGIEMYWLIDNVTVDATFEASATTTTTKPPETTTTTKPPETTTTTQPPETTTTTKPHAEEPKPGETTTTRAPETTTTTPPRTTTTLARTTESDGGVPPENREALIEKTGLAVTTALPPIAMPSATSDDSAGPRPHAEPIEALAAAFFTESGSYGGNLLPAVGLGIVIAVVSLLGVRSRRQD
jgi:hypothetical protein